MDASKNSLNTGAALMDWLKSAGTTPAPAAAKTQAPANAPALPATSLFDAPATSNTPVRDPFTAPPIQGGVANDVSKMNETKVAKVFRPTSEAEIVAALDYARANNLKVSMAGKRHSMGGHTMIEGGVLLDMNSFKSDQAEMKVSANKTVTVKPGTTWWDLQQGLDKQGFAVDVMQTPNYFTIGGALSVNAHGSNANSGPVGSSVESLRVLLPSGEIKKCSRTENPELFHATIGGFGLMGVVLDVELKVRDNEMYKTHAQTMSVDAYLDYFSKHLEDNPDIGYVHSILSLAPSSFMKEVEVVTYEKDPRPGEEVPKLNPLIKPLQDLVMPLVYKAASGEGLTAPFKEAFWEGAKKLAPLIPDRMSRNQMMTDSMEGYADHGQKDQTQIFQEYFIPRSQVKGFLEKMSGIVQAHDPNVILTALRAVKKDDSAMMGYAKEDVFGVVFAVQHKINEPSNENLAQMTRELVDAAQSVGGRQYLTYMPAYTPEKLREIYPEADQFFAIKQKYDPTGMMMNKFGQNYGPAAPANQLPKTQTPPPLPKGPGMEFAEKLSGTAKVDGRDVKVKAELKVKVPDVNLWDAQTDHPARIDGKVEVNGRTVPVQGTMQVMRPGADGARYLVYQFETPAGVEPPIRFAGAKQVKDDKGFDVIDDVTTIRGNFVERGVPLDGMAESTHPSATLQFHWKDPFTTIPFLRSFEVTGADSAKEAISARAKFLSVFFGALAEQYVHW